ncbi:MAG: urease accessory protein [Candidatus Tokpelaia sp. JSC161]|jgi:urease accessory protein|nr:MAG: urease accessory protein [Candidatus Tokpelaia sp. JSC161]
MEDEKKELSFMQRVHGKAIMSVFCRNGQTVLGSLFQEGSARLCFPKNNMASFEAVMINTGGGLTGGDHLEWDMRLCSGTDVIVTTQAAEKIYRSLDIKKESAKVDVSLSLSANSRLCWLPQETIIFNNSSLRRRLDVSMAEKTELLLSESIIFGRQLMGEYMDKAFLKDSWIIRQNGEVIHAEAFSLGPDIGREISMPVLFNNAGAFATILFIAPDVQRFLKKGREIVNDTGGISSWNGKLLIRLLSQDFYSLRKKLIALLTLLNTKGAPSMWFI